MFSLDLATDSSLIIDASKRAKKKSAMPRQVLHGEPHPTRAAHWRFRARGRAGQKVCVRLPCGCLYPITIPPAFAAKWATFRLAALPASSQCPACREAGPPSSPTRLSLPTRSSSPATRELSYADAEPFEDFMVRFESSAHFSRSSTQLVLPTWSANVKRVFFDEPVRWDRTKAKGVLRAMRVDFFEGRYEHPCLHTLKGVLEQEARNFYGEAVPHGARWELIRLAEPLRE